MNKLQNVRVRRVNQYHEGNGPWLPLSDVGAPGHVKYTISVLATFREEGVVRDYADHEFRHWSWFQF